MASEPAKGFASTVALVAFTTLWLAAVPAMAQQSPAQGGRADMRDASGRLLGVATFRETSEGLVVSGVVQDLPTGALGIHIHAVGRCDPPGFASAGPHFNPTGRQHGLDNPEGPHLGDLPNLKRSGVNGTEGAAVISATIQGATLTTGPTAVLDADGAALVITAGRDDGRTDPDGNAGSRIACGVITRAATQPTGPVATVGQPAATGGNAPLSPSGGGLPLATPLVAGLGVGLIGLGYALRQVGRR